MLLDFAILAAFVTYSVGMGFHFRRKASQGLEEYFLAGRSLRGWQAGFSMAATQYAADTPLLVMGLVATAGIFSIWRLWIYTIAFLMMGFLLAAAWRRARVLTDAELTELRYAGRAAAFLRALKAVYLGTLVNCTVLAMVLIAAARIAEPFLTWHLWLGPSFIEPIAHGMETLGFHLTTLPENHPEVWVVSADNFLSIAAIITFVWLYSATGGLRSVVATDVVQFSLMLLGTLFYAGFVLHGVGGFAALTGKLETLYGTETARTLLSFGPPAWNDVTFLLCAVLAVQWFAQVNADGTGYLAQRTMACRSDRDARSAAILFTFLQILLRSLLWLPIAVGLLILYPADPLPVLGTAPEQFRVAREALFAVGMRDLLPVGVRGLMLTAMLAALASTIDTHLNWGASYWTNDLYKRFLMERWLKRTPRARELVWVARFSTFGILALAFLVAVNLRSIQTTWHLSLLFGSGLGVVLILRWLWYRINVYSELTAVVASFVISPILLFGFPDFSEGVRLLWMTALSTLAVIGVTLLTRPEPNEVLRRFYTRVQPYGFWGPVAKAAGLDPNIPLRGFFRAWRSIGLACGSVFCLLVGIGSWMFRGSSQTFPFGNLFLIGVGLALIPLWIRPVENEATQ